MAESAGALDVAVDAPLLADHVRGLELERCAEGVADRDAEQRPCDPISSLIL